MKTIMVCTKIYFDMLREGFKHADDEKTQIVASQEELYYLMTPPTDSKGE